MPIVNDYHAVKDIYADAAERGVGLPLFCCEDRETLEAILAAAYEIGQEIGNPRIPITPAWTSGIMCVVRHAWFLKPGTQSWDAS